MIIHGLTQSTVKPEPLVIDEFSVWVNTNVKAVEATTEEDFTGFEYEMTQYNKDEYIRLMDEKTALVEKQLTDTQLALCEIFEGIG